MANMVLIHGAGDSSAVWENQAKALSQEHHVLAIDLPGHGARLAERASENHAANATEVVRLMDRAGMTRAVIVGHSMGGAIALTTALDYPDRIEALVLVATGARLRMGPALLEGAKRRADGLEPAAPGPAIPADMALSPSAPPEAVRWYRETAGQSSPQATYADYIANNSFDVMERLGELKAPTLVVAAADDRMAPPKFSQYLADHIPGATMVTIADSGHYPHAEQSEIFNQTLRDFLAAIHPRP